MCVCVCCYEEKKKRHEISCHQGGQFPFTSPSAVSLRCCARVQEMHLAVCRATSDPLVTSFGDRGHSVRGRYQERRTHRHTPTTHIPACGHQVISLLQQQDISCSSPREGVMEKGPCNGIPSFRMGKWRGGPCCAGHASCLMGFLGAAVRPSTGMACSRDADLHLPVRSMLGPGVSD